MLLLSFSACATLGADDVRIRALEAEPPANVSVYLSVASDAEPLDSLTAENFVLFEDERELSPTIARQTLLDKAVVVHHHTLLLIDNSLATDAEVRAELENAVAIFAGTVRSTQPVSVYAYDGSPRLTLVSEIPRAADPEKSTAPPAKQLEPKDVSRNLNGALLLGAEELDRRLAQSGKPFGVGTLVVFAAGADLAGRVEEAKVHDWLNETRHRVLAIGYGEQSDSVRAFGKDGYYDAVNQSTVSLAFEDAGHAVANEFAQGFLLSYCSPARNGQRVLRVEVRINGEQGYTLGGDTSEFNADGFRAGCDPTRLPRFAPSDPSAPTPSLPSAADE